MASIDITPLVQSLVDGTADASQQAEAARIIQSLVAERQEFAKKAALMMAFVDEMNAHAAEHHRLMDQGIDDALRQLAELNAKMAKPR